MLKIITDKKAYSLLARRLNALLLILCCTFALILSAITVNKITTFTVSANAGDVFSKTTVIIDAGHGGFDGGAVVDGISEKDINLKIANQISDGLKLDGIKVISTRTDDSSTESNPDLTISARKKSDLKNRLNIMYENPNSIFVSIHLNKFPQSNSVHGAQIFYSQNAQNSEILAECIRSSIVENVQPDNKRALKKGTNATYILKNATVPTVIAECGFMSNPEEFSKLQNEDYQIKMADAIKCGILEYIRESPN